MVKKLVIALLRYSLCVILLLIVLGLLRGDFTYLSEAWVWFLILLGAALYAALTLKDSKKGKEK